MPTKEPRLNVVLDKDTRAALAALAAHRDKTLSGVAADLIRDALEDQEDRYFSALVEERLSEKFTPLSSDEFWRRVKTKKAKKP